MKYPLISGLVAASIALGTTGCATILAGGPSNLTVEVAGPAEPTAIVKGVVNDDRFERKQPSFTVPLDRNTPYAVAVSADGYESELVIVKTEVTMAYWLNLAPIILAVGYTMSTPPSPQSLPIILGAELVTLGGILVDAVTKSVLRHSTQELKLRLQPAGASEAGD